MQVLDAIDTRWITLTSAIKSAMVACTLWLTEVPKLLKNMFSSHADDEYINVFFSPDLELETEWLPSGYLT